MYQGEPERTASESLQAPRQRLITVSIMAAARAAARRQAILSSRGDRLAKLTSSARGDDPGGVYAHDGLHTHIHIHSLTIDCVHYLRSAAPLRRNRARELGGRRDRTAYAARRRFEIST